MNGNTKFFVYRGKTNKLIFGNKYSRTEIAELFDRSTSFVSNRLKNKKSFTDSDLEIRERKKRLRKRQSLYDTKNLSSAWLKKKLI